MSPSLRAEPVDPVPETARPERLWRELVGEELKEIRRSRRETLQVVAQRARVSTQYLSEIERGRKEPSSEILAAISASLDTTLLDLTIGVATRLHTASSAAPSGGRADFTLAA